jgi:hypothetical protein
MVQQEKITPMVLGWRVEKSLGISVPISSFDSNGTDNRHLTHCLKEWEETVPKFDFDFVFAWKSKRLACSSFVFKALSFHVLANAIYRRSAKWDRILVFLWLSVSGFAPVPLHGTAWTGQNMERNYSQSDHGAELSTQHGLLLSRNKLNFVEEFRTSRVFISRVFFLFMMPVWAAQ